MFHWNKQRVCFYFLIDQDVQSNCKNLVLPPICTITTDCLNLQCKLKFLGKGVRFKMEIDTCKKRPIMKILVEVIGTKIKMVRKIRSSMMIAIPGFGVRVPVVGDAGVFVDVGLRPKGKNLSLRVSAQENMLLSFHFHC